MPCPPLRRTAIATDHALQQAYDALAARYDASRGLFDMQPVLDEFYSQLPAGSGALLDLGCGAGEPVAKGFVERGWDVTGVDFSASMLALAARYVPAMRTILADMREVAFAPISSMPSPPSTACSMSPAPNTLRCSPAFTTGCDPAVACCSPMPPSTTPGPSASMVGSRSSASDCITAIQPRKRCVSS